jgi:hypothetical protein
LFAFASAGLMIVGVACSSSSGSQAAANDAGGVDTGSREEAGDDGGSDDAVVTTMDSSLPPVEASPGVDSGQGADDAAVEASVCTGLGAPCKDSSTCLCGAAAGCTWDNVECTGGVCTVATPVPLDAGEVCCLTCEADFDACTESADKCLSQWLTCNDACPGGGGACPVVCLAEL